MGLAKQILEGIDEETVIDLSVYMEPADVIHDLLTDYADDNKNEDLRNELYQTLNDLSTSLDKEGFTYYSQPFTIPGQAFRKVLLNYADFFKEMSSKMTIKDLEIFNTNVRDVLAIIESKR